MIQTATAHKAWSLSVDAEQAKRLHRAQITAGALVLLGTLLGALVSPWFLLLSGFVGAGLTFAGLTGTCGMAMLLARLPYNQRTGA